MTTEKRNISSSHVLVHGGHASWKEIKARWPGDWKCGSGKCDTVKNAMMENAEVEMREQIAEVENVGVG